MSKGPPNKPPKKKAELGPIDEDDVEAAFSSIRLGSEPVGKEAATEVGPAFGDDDEESSADITGADELVDPPEDLIVGGAEFAPEHTDLAEVRKADSPSRRAQTNPAILEEIIDENYARPVPQTAKLSARSSTPVPGPRFNVSVPKTIPPPMGKDKPAPKAAPKPITGDAALDDPPTDAWAGTKYNEVPDGRAQPRALSQAGAEAPRRNERAMTAAEKAAHAAKSRLAAKQGQAAPSTSPSPRQPTQASPAVRAVAQRPATQAARTQSPSTPPIDQSSRTQSPSTPPPNQSAQSPSTRDHSGRTQSSSTPSHDSTSGRTQSPTTPPPPSRPATTMPAQAQPFSVAPQPTGPVQRTSASMAAQMPPSSEPVQRTSGSMAAVAPQPTGPVQRTSASMAAVAPQPTGPVQRTTGSVAGLMPQPTPRTAPPGPPPGSRVERLPLPPPRPSVPSFDDNQALEAPAVADTHAPSVAPSSRAQSFDIDVADLGGGRSSTLDRALDSALETRDEDLEAEDAAHQAALERALDDEGDDLDDDDDFGMLADPLPEPQVEPEIEPEIVIEREPEPVPQKPALRLPRVDLAAPKTPGAQPVATVEPADVASAVAHSADFAVEVPVPLRVAVHETAPNLQSVGLAIAGAGHLMSLGASGREGLAKVHKACTAGEVDALIVGLPGGEWLIQAALSLGPAAPVVIAACDGKPTEAIRMASAAGASLVAMRPHDPARIAPVLLAASRMAENKRDISEAREKEASLIARLDSQAEGHEAELGDLQPFDLFKRTLELELKRVKRYQYALSVALFALEIPDAAPQPMRGLLRARAGNALVSSIRDIDMATVLDNDRFLVLLPYTDLTGATHVARRILSAVDGIPPIKMAGVTVQAQLTGAIAGAKPGAQVSLGKLMKDATRALEAARRDGAELAVQP